MSGRFPGEVRPMPLHSLVDLVNDWGEVPRVIGGTADRPYPSVDSLRERDPEFWADFPGTDEATLIETANLIHPVFAAESGMQCAQRLNDLVALSQLQPALSSRDWSVREVWHSARPDRALLASATLALIEQLRDEPDASRLGTCACDTCVDAYVDMSPGGRRAYCSVTCQNRARARTYRANRKASTSGAD